MEYLHILPNSNLIYEKAIVNFINKNFNKKENVFLFNRYEKEIELLDKNNYNVNFLSGYKVKKFINKKNYMEEADYIFIHYLKGGDPLFLMYILTHPSILKKLVWVIWGADLYQWRAKKSPKILAYIINFFRKECRMKIKYVVLPPVDEQAYCKEFGTNHIIMRAKYPKGYDTETILQNRPVSKANKALKIMVGHSASSALNHIEALETISKYKDENVEVILPLTYGDNDYKEKVKKKAKEFFGSKVQFIEQNLPIEAYIQLLWKIDVAVFNTNRQIGMGNLTILLYMEKKIYFPKKSIMYRYFSEEGLSVKKYEDIKNEKISEFSKKNSDGYSKNYAEKMLNEKELVQEWKNVFMILENEFKKCMNQ